MSLRTFVRLGCALALVATVSGCECGTPTGGRRRDGGSGDRDGGGTGTGETGALCGDGLDNDMDGVSDCADTECFGAAVCAGVDTGVPRTDGGFGECTGRTFDANNGIAPVDIVWVIDNSGSMDEEASLIQERMNDFAAAIVTSGIEDYHVVVMTAEGWVTVPPPLGTDPEHFLFVNEDVQSNDPLNDALGRIADYRDFIRPDSVFHFVFVTDDESDLSAGSFNAMMETEVGRTYVANVIASPPGSMSTMCPIPGFCLPPMEGCAGPHGEAAANGDQYWALATSTGGARLSICAEDWTALFDDLLAVVAAPTRIPCRFEIPPPPDGMTFDRDRVNLVFNPGDGSGPVTIPRASDACASGRGWVYDDDAAPTQIILCPSDCSTVEGDVGGNVTVQLGCATVLI
jgi:hypothetical protein